MTINWTTPKVAAVATLVGALLSGVGLVAAQVGVRIVGPPESVESEAAERRAADAIQSQWNTMQDTVIAGTRRRVTQLEQTLQLIAYIQCVTLRQNTPALLPPACGSVQPPLEVP